MLLFENIALALAAIKANKTRSFLTMLGIIIGVASVIGIMTIGDAMSTELDGLLSEGINEIYLGVSSKENEGRGRGFRGPYREMSDSDYINKEMLSDIIDKYSKEISGVKLQTVLADSAEAVDGSDRAPVAVYGHNNTSLEGLELELLAGRLPSAEEYEKAKKVCVVSSKLCEDFFDGDADAAIGNILSVIIERRYYNYKIIGVYEYEEDEYYEMSSDDVPRDTYIPVQTAMEQQHRYNKYESVILLAASTENMERLGNEIASYMNRRYYHDNPTYEISAMTFLSVLEEIMNMMNSVRIGLSLVAGISLLVGGIGVMNIMLVSIAERTKEIGTRKALGATNVSIRTQFVVESIVLCIVGGIIGILLGVGIAYLGCKAIETEFMLSPFSILIAVGFSAAVGIFFGYYPANKAAKMNPIDALRYE